MSNICHICSNPITKNLPVTMICPKSGCNACAHQDCLLEQYRFESTTCKLCNSPIKEFYSLTEYYAGRNFILGFILIISWGNMLNEYVICAKSYHMLFVLTPLMCVWLCYSIFHKTAKVIKTDISNGFWLLLVFLIWLNYQIGHYVIFVLFGMIESIGWSALNIGCLIYFVSSLSWLSLGPRIKEFINRR